MSEEKGKTVSKPVKSAPARRKKPTLSQQVKDQAEMIENLMAQLQQKQQELDALNERSHLIDQLNQKLQEAEKTIKKTAEESAVQNEKLDDFRQRMSERKSQVTTASEQRTLIDDLTEKLQEVEIKLAATSIQSKHTVSQNTVKTHMIAGMTLGLLPAPLFDVAALTATQLNLLRTLSKHYDVEFDEYTGKTILTSLVSGSLPVLTMLGLSSFIKLVPGIGTIGGSIGVTTLAGAIIYATGQVFTRHFEAGGTFKDFNAKHWQDYFKEQLQEGKVYIKNKLDAPVKPAQVA